MASATLRGRCAEGKMSVLEDGSHMKKSWMALALLAILPWMLGGSCAETDKFRASKDLMGIVQLGPFPRLAPRVGGYNLYLAQSKDGPFDKINSDPILGGARLMVPYLVPGKDYYFRMTSISAKDASRESAPGQIFKRTALDKQP
jgi:hypothetical protein